MAVNKKQEILFLRNGSAFANAEAAKTGLDTLSHLAGQPVVAIFGENADQALFAIGVKAGTGEDCYELMSSVSLQDKAIDSKILTHASIVGNGTLGHVKSGADLSFSNGVGTIKNDAVTLDKIANASAANVLLGAKVAGGSYAELTMGDLLTMLNGAAGDEGDSSIVNQFAFSNIQVSGEDKIVADSMTDTLNIAGSANISIEADATGDSLTFSLVGAVPEAVKLSEEKTITIVDGGSPLTTKPAIGSVSTDFSGDVVISITVPTHNHVIADVEGLQTILDEKAPLADAVFTSVPQIAAGITIAVEDSSKKLATTEFVQTAIGSKLAASQAMKYKGTVGDGGTFNALPSSTIEDNVGDTYVAVSAIEVNSQRVEVGDMVICVSSGSTSDGTNWTIVQGNKDGIVVGPASSVDGDIAVFSGATGKIIKTGANISTLVSNTRQVTAGTGLVGGGALSSDVTISHGAKPTTGNDAGGSGSFVTGVSIDAFGHISGTTKGNLSVNDADAAAGKYISGVSVSGGTFTISRTDLPVAEHKVKVSSTDTAGFLGDKIISTPDSAIETDAKKYKVEKVATSNNVYLYTIIDKIDGGTY